MSISIIVSEILITNNINMLCTLLVKSSKINGKGGFKMNKFLLTKGLLIAANNKAEILDMLDGIDSENGDRGVIKITEDFINESCRDLILTLTQEKLDDYHISFRGGKIYLEIVAKVFIKAKARVIIKIEEFVFEPKKHELTISYQRDGITVANNFIPKILEKIVEANPGKIFLEENVVRVDFDQFGEIPSWVAVKYMKADMGAIEFAFLIA